MEAQSSEIEAKYNLKEGKKKTIISQTAVRLVFTLVRLWDSNEREHM